MIDLHTHSNASDGSLSPAALVKKASAAGISTLALTDHDCVAGVAQALFTAEEVGLQLIPGVELSVTWSGRTLHVLGLNIQTQHAELNSVLAGVLEKRRWRAEEIARKLEKAGIDGALEGARKYAASGLVSRTHFAHFLVSKSYAKNTRQVFKRYLVKGKPGHTSSQWMSLDEGVSLIHRAGGFAAIAHPARYGLSRTKLRGLFSTFKDIGGDAIEAVSGCHSKDENLNIAKHAIDFKLPVTAGSDYHGPEKPWIQLGKLPAVYYRAQPVWETGLIQTKHPETECL